jgi:hypothetical protein
MASQIALVPALVNSVQLGSPLTVWLKSVTSSRMQAEYSATVAMQVEGRSPQPGLGQTALGSAAWQPVSLLVQFDRNLSCVGGLLDVA